MPAFEAIVLQDMAATPVNHSFEPIRIDGSLARFADKNGGIPIGYGLVDVSIRPPVANSIEKFYLVTLRLKRPTLEVTSPSTSTGIQPAPTVAYNHIAEIKFWMSERGTEQDRKDLYAMVFGFSNNASIEELVTQLNDFY